jgi:hypothetical protein
MDACRVVALPDAWEDAAHRVRREYLVVAHRARQVVVPRAPPDA